MKRILAMLMALVLAFSFVSCSNGADGENDSKNAVEDKVKDDTKKDSKKLKDNGEKEAPKVVEAFFDAVAKFDTDTISKLVTDKSALPDIFKISKDEFLDTYVGEALADMPPEFAEYKGDLRKIFVGLVNKLFKEFSCDIKETKKESDTEYIVIVEASIPDAKAIENIDYEALLAEKMSEEKMIELVSGYLADGTLTATSTEEDVIRVLMPDIIDIIDDIFSDIEIDSIKQEMEFVVKFKNGKWLIDPQGSNLQEAANL